MLRKVHAVLRALCDVADGRHLLRRPAGEARLGLWSESADEETLLDALAGYGSFGAHGSANGGGSLPGLSTLPVSSSSSFDVHASLERAGATDTDAITFQPIAWRPERGGRPQAPDTFEMAGRAKH